MRYVARQTAADNREGVNMLYNFFCKVMVHHAFKFNKAMAILMVMRQSRLPKNLKQYYADHLLLMTVASD